MRVAIYARVSTRDKGQDPATQLRQLREWATRNGYDAHEYVDQASATDMRGRTAWRDLMAKSLRPRPAYAVIAFTSWDRAFRDMTAGVRSLGDLIEAGVQIVDLHSGLDTTTPMGRGMAAMLMALAEAWLDNHRKAVAAGMARARDQGKRIGRPRVRLSPARAAAAVEAHGDIRAAAAALGVGKSTVAKRAAEYRNGQNHTVVAKNGDAESPESASSGPGGTRPPSGPLEGAVQ